MPELVSLGAPGARSRLSISRGFFGAVLVLCLWLPLPPALHAQPLTRGRIEVRARVLEPVGGTEVPGVLDQLERDARLRLEAGSLLPVGRSGSKQLSQRLVDHDRLRIAILSGAEGYTLQLESLAN
jgi:hypothetical protein